MVQESGRDEVGGGINDNSRAGYNGITEMYVACTANQFAAHP